MFGFFVVGLFRYENCNLSNTSRFLESEIIFNNIGLRQEDIYVHELQILVLLNMNMWILSERSVYICALQHALDRLLCSLLHCSL